MDGLASGLVSCAYRCTTQGNKRAAPEVSARCKAFAAVCGAGISQQIMGQFQAVAGVPGSRVALATKFAAASSDKIRGFSEYAC